MCTAELGSWSMGEGNVRLVGKYKGNMLRDASRALLEIGVVIAQRTSARGGHSFGSGTPSGGERSRKSKLASYSTVGDEGIKSVTGDDSWMRDEIEEKVCRQVSCDMRASDPVAPFCHDHHSRSLAQSQKPYCTGGGSLTSNNSWHISVFRYYCRLSLP